MVCGFVYTQQLRERTGTGWWFGCHQFFFFSHSYWVDVIIPIDEIIFHPNWRNHISSQLTTSIIFQAGMAFETTKQRGKIPPRLPEAKFDLLWYLQNGAHLLAGRALVLKGGVDGDMPNMEIWWMWKRNIDGFHGLIWINDIYIIYIYIYVYHIYIYILYIYISHIYIYISYIYIYITWAMFKTPVGWWFVGDYTSQHFFGEKAGESGLVAAIWHWRGSLSIKHMASCWDIHGMKIRWI